MLQHSVGKAHLQAGVLKVSPCGQFREGPAKQGLWCTSGAGEEIASLHRLQRSHASCTFSTTLTNRCGAERQVILEVVERKVKRGSPIYERTMYVCHLSVPLFAQPWAASCPSTGICMAQGPALSSVPLLKRCKHALAPAFTDLATAEADHRQHDCRARKTMTHSEIL